MEFIVFSDIHFSMNRRCSYILPDGRSSWLVTQLDLVEQIFDYARENNIEFVFFDGDLFEDKSKIDTTVYNAVWELFANLVTDGFKIFFNTGNHDIYTQNRRSSLMPFSDIVAVITQPEDFPDHNYLIRIIPYGMTEGNLKVDKTTEYDKYILFTHENIAGLKLGPTDYVGQSNLKPILFSRWDYVFNGHIHKPQILKNVYNVGSPMQQDFGEAGEEKGFLHYKDGEIIRVPLDSPKFITVSGFSPKLEKKISKNDRDFFRVDIESSELSNPIFEKHNVFHNIVKSEKREIRLKEVMSEDEELKEYINTTKTELDKKKLFNIGKEIISEC